MLQPLNNISKISKNIVILVAIAGAVILTLIIILSVRERRYEIGVLMSLGESRIKIIGQFFAELFIVTLISIAIASAAGNVVGNTLGNQLLSSSSSTTQTTSQQNDGPGNGQGGPGGGGAPDQDNNSDGTSSSSSADSSNTNSQKPSGKAPSGGGMGGMMSMTKSSKEIDKLNVKLSVGDVAKLGGIALIISFVSTILASIGIIRMKPKDILSSN